MLAGEALAVGALPDPEAVVVLGVLGSNVSGEKLTSKSNPSHPVLLKSSVRLSAEYRVSAAASWPQGSNVVEGGPVK